MIDGRNFYDQAINDVIKQYDEVRKTSSGQGDDYTAGCLLDYAYFKDYKLIAVDLRKQKDLDADPRAVQQIVFQGIAKQKLRLYNVFEKSKESLGVLQRNTKRFVRIYKWLNTIK